jgi:hypothetical protein
MLRRAAVLLVMLLGAARASAATEIELYTMGPGNDIFEAFGHATLCVHDAENPDGVCYNYGVTNFDAPVNLIWTFVRGKAQFWVQRKPLPKILDEYTADDRTIYRQKLALSEEAAAALAHNLENDLLPENRTYFYHHYKDNCTTRLRDHLDHVTGGLLSRGSGVAYGPTFRELSRKGFAGSAPMLIAVELVLGEPADVHASLWQAMFLPEVLRAEVEKRLGAKPETMNLRRGPIPDGNLMLGQYALFGGAFLLGLLALFGTGRSRGWRRAALIIVGLLLGLIGLAFYVVALMSVMPEMRRNELLLVFMPTDLLLLFLGGRLLTGYLLARILLLLVLVAGVLTGHLVQPLWAPIAVVGVPLLIFALSTRKPVPA